VHLSKKGKGRKGTNKKKGKEGKSQSLGGRSINLSMLEESLFSNFLLKMKNDTGEKDLLTKKKWGGGQTPEKVSKEMGAFASRVE